MSREKSVYPQKNYEDAGVFRTETWRRPAAAFSQCPFWFWNDTLSEAELVRQIADFQAHGVEAFVIHARIGLPRECGWLSDELFRFMRIALAEARRRGMWVLLYDEGMYPSGAAGGLVVARDASFQTRGLVCETVIMQANAKDAGVGDSSGGMAGETTETAGDAERARVAVVTRGNGERVAIYERKIDAVVRGLHYIGDENDSSKALGEEEPVAADLLNPRAVECFIELVYERFYRELGEFFGDTVVGIFTDEPHPLSRSRDPGARPGGAAVLAHVNRYLGYDFTPHLPALWFDDEPDALRHRRAYAEAIAARLDETYYAPLSRWCERHGVALTGHPAEPDDIGHLKHLHIPGQDIVWRHVEPDKPSALEGAPSTMAKAAASVAFHRGRARNLNEFAGAYGWELTFGELRWLASWLLIRGCNLLVPHAFYYSMRGPRRHERPPDVGPNNAWWPGYKTWADMTRRLCWLNATFKPVCEVAILGRATELPWRAAKACFENQVDFHYVEPADLAAGIRYAVVIIEDGFDPRAGLASGEKMDAGGEARCETVNGFSMDSRVLRWPKSGEDGVEELLGVVAPVVVFDSPAPTIRARRLAGRGVTFFLLFNEGSESVRRRIEFPVEGSFSRLDPESGDISAWDPGEPLTLAAHAWAIVKVEAIS